MIELERDNSWSNFISLFTIFLSEKFGMLCFSFARPVYKYSVNLLGRAFTQFGSGK